MKKSYSTWAHSTAVKTISYMNTSELCPLHRQHVQCQNSNYMFTKVTRQERYNWVIKPYGRWNVTLDHVTSKRVQTRYTLALHARQHGKCACVCACGCVVQSKQACGAAFSYINSARKVHLFKLKIPYTSVSLYIHKECLASAAVLISTCIISRKATKGDGIGRNFSLSSMRQILFSSIWKTLERYKAMCWSTEQELYRASMFEYSNHEWQ